jgi:hypothetical protein
VIAARGNSVIADSGHYELAADAPPMTRVAAAFTELAQAI